MAKFNNMWWKCHSAKTAGVFHLRSPAGKYMMNYSTAEANCKAEGATLATLSQLSDAQQVNQIKQITGTKCSLVARWLSG